MRVPRSRVRRNVLAGALGALLLAGCGFQLRNSQTYGFQSIALTPARGSPVALELARYLGNAVRVVSAPDVQPPPDVILDIVQEKREKTVVGVNASGQVREFQLRLTVKFRLRTPQGAEPIATSEIVQQRDISFSETAVLAKEAEEALLYKDMQADIVQQLLRRLGSAKVVNP
jgi:LPS-assembly lipoprotein